MKRKSLALLIALSMIFGNSANVFAIDIDTELNIEDEEIVAISDDEVTMEYSTVIEDASSAESAIEDEPEIEVSVSEDANNEELDLNTDSSDSKNYVDFSKIAPLNYMEIELDKPYENPDFSDDASYNANSNYTASKYVTSNLPKLRNQNPYGTCWAFGSIALAEINLIKKGLASSDIDLSELHLAYFTYNSVVDPLGGTEGDHNGMTDYGISGDGEFMDRGGGYTFSQNVFASWAGAADESIAPYSSASEVVSKYKQTGKGLEDSIAFEDVAHLTRFYDVTMATYLQDKDNKNSKFKDQLAVIKKLIVDCGAVGICFRACNSCKVNGKSVDCYNSDNNAFYCPEYGGSNHAVVIVGWDDDFSKSNFNSKAPGNGAWLVRNSWMDEDAGYPDKNSYYGYFWMSYYDGSLSTAAYAFDFELVKDYDHNYQYDGAMYDTYMNGSKAANVFTVQGGSEKEVLKAVSFVTKGADQKYTVEIYTDLTDDNNPVSGNLIASQNGKTDYEGYYTIPLDKEITLSKGDKFSVAITLTDSSGNDAAYAMESGADIWYDIKCSAKEGQSFLLYYGHWFDCAMYNRNFRIKAFTDDYTEESTEESTDDSSEASSEASTEASTDDSSEASSEASTDDSSEASSEDSTDDSSEASSESSTEDSTDDSTEDSSEDNSDEVKKYTVTYVLNGGTNNSENPTEYLEGSYHKLKDAMAPEGYKFEGWFTEPEFQHKKRNILGDKGDLVLYAKYSKALPINSITYVLDGGTNNPDNPGTYSSDKAVVLKKATKEGYTFVGWYNDSSFTKRVNRIKKGSSGEKVLYAKWKPIKYTVKFVGNGKVTGKTAKLRLSYDELGMLNENGFKKKGYEFSCWSTKRDGTGTLYSDRAFVHNLASKNGKVITLYAQWDQATYKIDYELDGGEANPENPSEYTVATPTFKLAAPTKAGYVFKGWYKKYENGKFKGKVTKIAKGSAGDLTLYAKWEEIKKD